VDIEYLYDEIDNSTLDSSTPSAPNGVRQKMFQTMDADGLLN